MLQKKLKPHEQMSFSEGYIRRILILEFSSHAEFISASMQLKEVLKQVQDDEVIFESFIITLYQYFPLKEPNNFIFVSSGQFCAHIKTFFQVCRKLFFSVLLFVRFTEPCHIIPGIIIHLQCIA